MQVTAGWLLVRNAIFRRMKSARATEGVGRSAGIQPRVAHGSKPMHTHDESLRDFQTKIPIMKTIYLSLVSALAIAPVLALADDNIKEANSKKEGASDAKTTEEQAAPRSETKSPQADPTVTPGKAGVTPEVPKMPGQKFEGQVTAVDPAEKTVTITDEKAEARTIQVLDNTKGALGAEAAAWGDFKVGAQVKGVYRKDGEKLVAESISVIR